MISSVHTIHMQESVLTQDTCTTSHVKARFWSHQDRWNQKTVPWSCSRGRWHFKVAKIVTSSFLQLDSESDVTKACKMRHKCHRVSRDG